LSFARAPLPAALVRRGDGRLLHRPRRQRARPRVVSRTVHSPAFRLRGGGWTTCCRGRRGSLRTRRSTRTRRSPRTRRSIHSHSCSGRWVHCRTSRSFPRCRKRPSSGPATVLTGGPEPLPVVGRSTSRLALQPTTPLRVAQQLSPVSSWCDAFTVQARRYSGEDIRELQKAGVPVVSLRQDGLDYFDAHHTADDTLDKIDPKQLDQAVAVWSVFTYLAAASDVDFRSLTAKAK
jgi:hypothetical protein